MKLLLNLLDALTPYGTFSYVVIVGILVGCGFGFPLPEDIVLVTGGVLASRGIIDLHLTMGLTLLGVLVGDGIIFTLGSKFGPRLRTTKFFRFILPESREETVKKIVEKYGEKVIFMARFMPGFRTPVFFITGSYHVPFWKFFLFDGVAALISVPLWVYVGFMFGSNLETLEKMIRRFQWGIYIVILAAIVGIVAFIFMKKKAMQRLQPPS